MADTCVHTIAQEDKMVTQLGFATKLASPHTRKREKAMSLLCLWLTSQREVKEDELEKIWRGLFYCIRHAEKSPEQAADLIDRLASLMEKLEIDLSLMFFKVFLTTLRREWVGVDRAHLDKFHLLLRKYICHMFAVLDMHGWEAEVIKRFMDALLERTLLTKDQTEADGVNCHIADVFLHDLKRFSSLQLDAFEHLLEPFWTVLAKGCDKAFVNEVAEKIFWVLFDEGFNILKAKQEGQVLDETVEYFGTVVLTMPISAMASKLAALPSIPDSNLKRLHQIHEKFINLDKLVAESGISMVFPNLKRRKQVAEIKIGASTMKASPLVVASNDVDGDLKGALISSKQTRSAKSFKRSIKKRQRLGSSLQLPTAGRTSLATIEVNENVPPEKGFLDCVLTEGLKACPQQVVAGPDKVSSTEKNQKYSRERVFGASLPETCLESQTQAAEIAKTLKGRQKCGSLNKSKLDNLLVLQSNTGDREETLGEIESSKQIMEADTPCGEEEAKLRGIIDENSLALDDSVVSNLASRFDSIAEEPNSCLSCSSPAQSFPLAASPINTGSKKRKNRRSSPANSSDAESPSVINGDLTLTPTSLLVHDAASIDTISTTKKTKKVHFSLKHNLVWKPSSPLPPEILRVPPSATPRGSALKKGVPPGPILVLTEISPRHKKVSSKRTPPSVYRTSKTLKSSAKGPKVTKKRCFSPR